MLLAVIVTMHEITTTIVAGCLSHNSQDKKEEAVFLILKVPLIFTLLSISISSDKAAQVHAGGHNSGSDLTKTNK